MSLLLALRTLHVCANLLWIGSIVATAFVLRASSAAVLDRGRIALTLYRTVATPAFGISFLAAITLLVLQPGYYLVQSHWMHAKLPLALGVIVLHHWFGLKAKRMARNSGSPPSALPATLLVVGAMGAAALALLKPF
jgi:putative membrane protein